MQPISTPIKPQYQGAEVANLQQALRLLLNKGKIQILGTEYKPTLIAFGHEQQDQIYGDATKRLVQLFQEQYGIANPEGIVDKETANQLNAVLESVDAFKDTDDTVFVVKGFIRQSDGSGYNQGKVVAYDKDLRREEVLNEVSLKNSEGYYEISYTRKKVNNAEKSQADLYISVFAAETAVEPLLSSEVYFNALPVQEINLTLPAVQGPSEWTILEELVPPLLIGQKKMPARPSHVGDVYGDLLPEELISTDFEFLGKETGLEREHLRLWAGAYAAAKEAGSIAGWAYYAWFRMGLPTELKGLLARSPEELKKTLSDALAQNIISATKDQLDKVFTRVAGLLLEFPLRPALEGEASLGDVLNTAGVAWLTEEKKKRYVSIAPELDPDAADFMDKTKAIELEPNEQNTLRKTLRLGKLTMNHPPLMIALQTYVAEDDEPTLKSLAGLAQDQWIDLAYTYGVAAGNVSSPEAYALQLAQATEDRLPTVSLYHKIKTDEVLAHQVGSAEILTFLEQQPDFDIVAANLDDLALDDESKGLLQKLQNLKKVGVRWNNADAFLNRGITSLTQIVEYSPEQLKAILEEDVEHEQIAIVHANATAAQNIGIALMGYLQPLLYGVKAHVMQPLTETAQTGTELRSTTTALSHLTDPNLRNLFGVLEQCACDPCLSVLSPAAYYADLLRFIDASGNAGNTLRARRPDLYDLELSCENAQIELPYIDLVLEILENQVAFPEPIDLLPGVTISEQLKDDGFVGGDIKDALKKTSETILSESLSAEKGKIFNTNPPITTWVVKDRYRRWALNSIEESLAFYAENAVFGFIRRNSFDLTGFDILDLLAWLNNTNPNNETFPESSLKRVFEDALLEKKLLAGNLVYSVSKVKDFHWKIEYEIKSLVITEIYTGQSFIRIGNTDGTKLISKEYGKKAVEAAASQLGKGKTPRILKSGIEGKHTTVEPKETASVSSDPIVSKHTIKNHIISSKKTIHLFYNPAHLYIQGLTYQSTKANANLFAQPQNRNPLAYEELAKTTAVYPWSLPYSQPLTETRLLLEKAGTSRLKLINATLPDEYLFLELPDENKFSDAAWAKELLGISAAQQKSITDIKSADSLYFAWGLTKSVDLFSVYDHFKGETVFGSGLELLQRASIVMQQAGIDYVELQGLLQSEYINRDKIDYTSLWQGCDPTEMSLYASLDFDKLHRFIRLWRVLGWTTNQVDQALMADEIGAGKLDNDTIKRIAEIKALHQQFDLQLDVLLALFTPFSNEKKIAYTSSGKRIETPSLYNQIFQNKLVQNPVIKDLAFTILDKNTQTQPPRDAKTWSELLPSISGALGIRQPDLESFLQSGIADFAPFKLILAAHVTLNHLQSVWQHLTLARALKLPLAEYSAACKLLYPAASPFGSPLSLLIFIHEIQFIENSGIQPNELAGILNGENEEELLPVETAYTMLTDLQVVLKAVTTLNFDNFKLDEKELTKTPFIAPVSESERWTYWGLTKVATPAATQNWSVKNPDSVTNQLVDLPLELLQQEPVLIQQVNLLLPTKTFNADDLIEILRTSFVSPLGVDELKMEPFGLSKKIKNLSVTHLDRLIQFVFLKNLTGLPSNELDNWIKTVFPTGNEPLHFDLKKLIEAFHNIALKQQEVMIDYFARLYQQDSKSIAILLLNKITVHIPIWGALFPSTKSFSALNFLSSYEFWNQPIKEDKLEESHGYKILIKLKKLFILNQYWKATPVQLDWLGKWGTTKDFLYLGLKPDQLSTAVGNIPYLDWKRTTLLFETAQASLDLETIFTDYLAVIPDEIIPEVIPTVVIKARTILAVAFGLKLSDVEMGAALLEMNPLIPIRADPSQINKNFDPLKLCRLINYLSELQKLGLNASQYATLISEPATVESVRLARQILFARYGASNFADALKEVNNRLRPQQRNVLVDYLIWRDQVQDANDLYKKYLIDVEMSACMRTTRLLQSTAAAQLFVHRCLLNLELDVNPESFDKKRWEWTKNYRVWEANRKVFLYPENWLYPELRDDKTATFKSFETELSQNEASDENSVMALRQYLDDLIDVSQISVLGMYEHSEDLGELDENRNPKHRRTLYLVGRSPNTPYIFYWRQALYYGQPEMRWTGWERIDQDLSGDHIVPFVLDGDFHIAWPLIKPIKKGHDDFYEIQMAWARKTSTGWTKRKTSRDPREVKKPFYRDERSLFAFKYVRDGDLAAIACCVATPPRPQDDPPPFYYDETRTTPALIDKPKIEIVIAPDGNKVSDISGDIELKIHLRGWKIFYGNGDKNPDKATKTKYVPIEIILMREEADQIGFKTNKFSSNGEKHKKKIQFHSSGIGSYSGPDDLTYTVMPFNDPQGIQKALCTVKLPIYNGTYSFEIGTSYDIHIDIVFYGGVNNDINLVSGEAQLEMKSYYQFVIYPGSDGVWRPANPSLSFTPPDKLYSWSSGFREAQIYSSGGLPDVFSKSDTPQFFALQATRSDRVSSTLQRFWYIEEGSMRFFAKENPTSLWLSGLSILPAAFDDPSKYKSGLARSLDTLFSLSMQQAPTNSVFGLDKLGTYFPIHLPVGKDPRLVDIPAFDPRMPYALYNWEVFYHLPLATAYYLSKQHRFEEARKWFHYVFDPTSNEEGTGRKRFWRFLPFRNNNNTDSVSKLLNVLSNPLSGAKQGIRDQIKAWLADPFNPFAVARLRVNAYEWFTVAAYIKNLIEWGDQLFRRDTRESINEATLLYVMASDILGRRPMPIRSEAKITNPLSYRALKEKGLDGFSNTWIKLIETPLGKALLEKLEKERPTDQYSKEYYHHIFELIQLSSIGSTYFCVPPNEKILELWDTVADRLFKIRNCQNFDGITRNLPLLDPPIDPELLIRAKAAGLSTADAMGDLYAPPPLYRFNVWIQKAIDLCNEVKGLGAAMLSAIEKKETEHLSLLRSGQEIEMQKLVTAVREEQIKEAGANIEALNKSRENIIARVIYLQRQMGNDPNASDAEGIPILDQTYITQPLKTPDILAKEFTGSNLGLTKTEEDQILWMQTSNVFNVLGGSSQTAAGVAHTIAAGFGTVESAYKTWTAIGQAASAVGSFFNIFASHYSMLERRSGMIAGWQRRRDEWLYQAKTAVAEIKQIDKQIIASEIRRAIAQKELDNHRKQIEHTKTLDDYVRTQKFSRETLYVWMESQLSLMYKTAFNLAFEQAKKAEKAFRFELGDELARFINTDYWDTLHRGLLAGEGLAQDLKRMEVAYLDRNRRELEITKHISLRQINPLALLALREDDQCEFSLPEVLFDMDFPGHYKRRIKSVSITIPCIAGPYTGLNATLRLLKNEYRKNETGQIVSSHITSTAIAVSTGQNDSGLFEFNFRDERYLPFEGAGAISTWRLELPSFRQFDYDTISDAVIHVRYTAVEGGERLKKAATDAVQAFIKTNEELSQQEGLFAIIDLKHDLPTEWHKAMQVKGTTRKLHIPNIQDFLPYYAQVDKQGKKRESDKMEVSDVFLITSPVLEPKNPPANPPADPPEDLLALSSNLSPNANFTFVESVSIGDIETFAIQGAQISVGDWTLTIKTITPTIEKAVMVLRFKLKGTDSIQN